MALQKLSIRVDTTNRRARFFDGTPFRFEQVNGDSVLLVCHMQEQLVDGTFTDLVMTGATAIKAILKSARTASATQLAYQTAYNQGDYTANEDLSVGKFTSKLNLNTRTTTDVVDSAVYRWTQSPAAANEYYCELLAGGDPSLSQPNVMFENGLSMTAGTIGSLASGEWAYGDNDSLGFSTIYVRIGSDPDSQADGYLQADYNGAIETLLNGSESKSCFLELSWVDSAGNPHTLLQQAGTIYEELDREVSGVAAVVAPTYVSATVLAGTFGMKGDDTGPQDGKVVAQHGTYTVPTGKKFWPFWFGIETVSITGSATPPTCQCGTTADPDAIAVPAALTKYAAGEIQWRDVKGVAAIPAGTAIECGITSAGTSTTHSINMYIIGLITDA